MNEHIIPKRFILFLYIQKFKSLFEYFIVTYSEQSIKCQKKKIHRKVIKAYLNLFIEKD